MLGTIGFPDVCFSAFMFISLRRANDAHEPLCVSRVVFNALARSDFFLDIFSGDFTIPENLGNESATDGLATMDGNHGAPAIGVT